MEMIEQSAERKIPKQPIQPCKPEESGDISGKQRLTKAQFCGNMISVLEAVSNEIPDCHRQKYQWSRSDYVTQICIE